jgi:hypothetical protein
MGEGGGDLDYDDLNSTHELKLENPSKRNMGLHPLKGKGLAYSSSLPSWPS